MGEVDIALRHLCVRFGDAVATTYNPTEHTVRALGWSETQLTRAERRLDKALEVELDGRLHLLHLEFQSVWDGDLPWRIYEYQSLLASAHREAQRPAPIRSVVVVLRSQGAPQGNVPFNLGWTNQDFCGAHFFVDCIDRLTLQQLRDRHSPFWLALAPLTTDITLPNLQSVIDDVRRDVTDPRHLADIAATMLVLAERAPHGPSLASFIQSALPGEVFMNSSIYNMGLEKGLEKGREEGREEGELHAISHLYGKRLGRPLTDTELAVLHDQLDALGSEHLLDLALERTPDTLEAWLAQAGTAAP